jgi:Cu2+-exporting ATPase
MPSSWKVVPRPSVVYLAGTVDNLTEMKWPEEWQDAARRRVCLHCGNGLGHFWSTDDGPFCCRGCKAVYEMIHQANLDRYYDIKPETHAPAATLRPDSFNWLDRLLAEQEHRRHDGGALHLDLDIQGVHCAACVWLIGELFKRREAGLSLRINPTLGKVELSWDPARGELKEFLAEIEKFGYRLGPPRKGERKGSRALLLRMAISISMAMNVMMFSLSYYFGLDEGQGALYMFFGWLSLGLATISLIAGGGVFFRGAIQGLRRRVAHLDLPISLGMILAYSGSVYGFLAGGPEHAYFDSLTVFIALMLVGRWAQEHILERNRNALLDSSGAENLTVKRLRDGQLEAVAATEIRQNDELWIAPGDLLPVQGILMRQPTQVALDWITGESDQVGFQPGETIPAGAFNASQQGFSVTACEDFEDSRLQDLLRSTTLSDDDFKPQWWHNISTWYVTFVLIAAGAGLLGWMMVDVTRALKVTISILVVTCPCALGLATPLAEELVHFALRRHGVFLRKPSFLEKALAVKKVLLDKTGTLTMGHLVLHPDDRAALADLDPRARAVLRHMTGRSNHPVSQSLAAALRDLGGSDQGLETASAEKLQEIPGSGLRLLLDDGDWRLGHYGFALAAGSDHNTNPEGTFFVLNETPLASFRLSEDFKPDAPEELAVLLKSGFELYLLSGDAQAKVDTAARALGLPLEKSHGGLTPEAKAELVRTIDQKDTLMVGDGLNDSPSFEAALCAATPAVDRPVLPGKADFYFLGDGIAAIRRSLLAARHLRKVVRDNLAIAILYNLGAVALCLAGLVTPVVAAILMPISSVFVVSLTAIRLSSRRLPWI